MTGGRRDSRYGAAADRRMRKPQMNMIPPFRQVRSGKSFTRRADRLASTTISNLDLPMRISHLPIMRRSNVMDEVLGCQKNTSIRDACGGIAG